MALEKVFLLNGFRLIGDDDQPITKFYSQKTKALFAYLLLEGANRGHSRSHLAGLLWPDSPENRARRNLSQTLTALRKDLKDQPGEDSLFIATTQDVSISPKSIISVDAWAFQTHLAAVQKHDHVELSTCQDCFKALSAAAELYTGPLLEQFGGSGSSLFENWLIETREAFHQRAITTFSSLASCNEAFGDIEKALRNVDRLIELAPWQESAHRQRMLLLAKQGKRIAALAQYDILSDMLMQELGVAPSAETDALYDKIEAGEVESQPKPPAAAETFSTTGTKDPPSPSPFQTPPSSPHFVGRDHELALISTLLLDEKTQGIPVALVGMGGVGKSTLAAKITHQLKERFKDGVLWGNPVISNPLDILDVWAQAFGHDFSNLPDIESKATAVRGLLANKEALVVLDNVDDAAGVRSLFPSGSKCQVLLTTRSLEVAAALNARHVRMKEFTAKSSETLMLRILGESRLEGPPEQIREAQKISRQLHHLPLAIEIAAQRLRSRPSMPLASMAARLENTQQRLGLKISDQAVRSSFEVSWEGLDPQTQTIFAAMGIFEGLSFTAEALVAITQLDLFDVEDELYTLAALSLVNQADGDRYQQHPLLADFAAEKLSIDPENQSLAQSNIVNYYLNLVQNIGTNYELLSPEWEQLAAVAQIAYASSIWDKLIQLIHLLTPAWKSRGRYSQARQAYQLGREAAVKLQDYNNEALLLLRWGEVALEQNDYKKAEEILTTSMESHLRLENDLGIAKIKYLLARIEIEQNRLESAALLLDESRKVLAKSDQSNHLGYVLFYQGYIAFTDGFRLDESEALLLQALEIFDQEDEQVGKIDVLRMLSQIEIRRENFSQAETLVLESISLSEKILNQSQLGSNLFALTTIFLGQEKFDLAIETGGKSLEILRRTGQRRTEGMVLRQLSRAHKGIGRLSTAESLILQSIEIFQSLGTHLSQAFSLNELGQLYFSMGRQADAGEAWQAALGLAKQLKHDSLQKTISENLSRISIDGFDTTVIEGS